MFKTVHRPIGLQIAIVLIMLLKVLGASPVAAVSSIGFGWAKRVGGTSYDHGAQLTVDVNGNVYTTGNFSGTVDFDPGVGVYNLTSNGDTDAFISKLDGNGGFAWGRRIGGTLSDSGDDIALDENGNVYSIGGFYGTVDFDPGTGTYNLSSAGLTDIYIIKLDGNGNFVWAKRVGGIDYDDGYSLVVDNLGNLYLTGSFDDTADFDPGPGSFNLTSAGDEDMFISKYDQNGNLVWAHRAGAALIDRGTGLTADDSGNVYTIGEFSGTVDFDPGANVYNLSSAGWLDIFISKLNSNGEFVWARNMGGTASDTGADIEIDENGSIYGTGSFNNTADFDPGAGVYNLTSNGYWDFFISKFDNNGNFVWAKSMGGTLSDDSYAMELDTSGNIYTAGGFASSTVDFDPGPGAYTVNGAGNGDIFISKLDLNGEFVWAKSMGGPIYDYGLGIAVDGYRNVYTIGNFTNTADFNPGADTYNLTSAGYLDIFISKLTSNATFIDVPDSHPFHRYIEAFARAGITVGCSQAPKKYCPDANVTRGEMAVFIERARGNYNPPTNAVHPFDDVPYPGLEHFTNFIELFYSHHITTGCQQNPLMYCPQNNVTRGEMAVFIERALGKYDPPTNAVHPFVDVPYPGLEHFTNFIEQFYNDGITVGCQQSPRMYCPQNNVTRGEMAVFIVRAFNIPLP